MSSNGRSREVGEVETMVQSSRGIAGVRLRGCNCVVRTSQPLTKPHPLRQATPQPGLPTSQTKDRLSFKHPITVLPFPPPQHHFNRPVSTSHHGRQIQSSVPPPRRPEPPRPMGQT